jgi:hypothetical protein
MKGAMPVDSNMAEPPSIDETPPQPEVGTIRGSLDEWTVDAIGKYSRHRRTDFTVKSQHDPATFTAPRASLHLV